MKSARFDFSGYRRPDMIGYIYEGKFELVPATGLNNLRYYAQAVADLTARCPVLELDAARKGVDRRLYWFEQVPERVSSGRVQPALRPWLGRIDGARSVCPAAW